MASIIQKMPCHVIVIAHPDEYQKKKMPDRSTQRSVSEADMEIEWTRMIPKSSSKPHGLTLGQFFTGCGRSEEHTSELQSLMRISYAVFCLKTKNKKQHNHN